jgi:hypothetical protein
MNELRTEIENIESDLERAYVIERSQVQTDKDGYINAGMSKTTFYTWPTERRDYLNTLARRLNTEVAIQIIMELQGVGRQAAIVKANGLKSRNEQIKQRTATEILEWLIGKPTQRVDQKTELSGDIIVTLKGGDD